MPEVDPLRTRSRSFDSTSSEEGSAGSEGSDAISLSSLYSLKTTSDPDDPDGVVKISSLYSKAIFVKNSSQSSVDGEGGNDDKSRPMSLADDVFDDETCASVCFQPLVRQCLLPRSHSRPTAGEVALQMGVCHGGHCSTDSMKAAYDKGLMHFSPEAVQFGSKGRRIWCCSSSQPRIVSISVPEMMIRSASFSNPAVKETEQVTPASRFSTLACTPMPKRKGQRVSSGTLVWIATLSGHLLAFNAETMSLEGHAKLPTTVVSMCMLSNSTQRRRSSKESVLLAVGLADGRVAVVKASMKENRVKIGLWEQLDVTSGHRSGRAVATMTLSPDRKTMWLAHGTHIIAVDAGHLGKICSWECGHTGEFCSATVRCLASLNLSGQDNFTLSLDGEADVAENTTVPVLCSSARRCSTIRLWNNAGHLLAEIDCR